MGITAIFFLLWAVVLLKGKDKSISGIYSLFVGNMALWAFGLAMFYYCKSPRWVFFWAKELYVAGGLIASSFLCFSFAFPSRKPDITPKKLSLIFIPNLILFILFFFTPVIINGVIILNGIRGFTYGPGHILFDIHFYIIFGWAFLRFLKGYKQAKGVVKTRLRYIIIGTLTGVTLAGITNVVMTWLGRFELLWLGPPLTLTWLICIVYAIIRYRLMEIEVIIKKTLVFAGLSIFVVGIFALAAFIVQDILGKTTGIPRIWTLVISAMIIAASIDPIKNFLVNATDKYLFQKKYNPVELINAFSKTVLTELDLDKIAKSTVNKLVEALKLTSCALLVPSREGNKFTIRKSYGIENPKVSYDRNSPMMSYLNSVNNVILKKSDDPLAELIIKDMRTVNADACLAIMMRRELRGVLCMGKKKSDIEYTKDDIDILIVLADALGVAITNALAFEDVRQKEKLAAVGMLAAGIKHDIGTPLNKMSSAAQMFLIERDEGDHHKKPLTEVLSSAYDIISRCQMTFDKVSRISSKFADFAKPKRTAELERINIAESIEEALGVLDCDIRARGIDVIKDIQRDIPPIVTDKEYMQEILFNIIKNAAQAIQEARRGKDEAVLTITAKSQLNKSVVVEIKDTGVGIPEDDLRRVFDSYYTTKQESGGTGLGLAIVKELTERNRGKISIKSKVGIGTTFILEFPGAGQ